MPQSWEQVKHLGIELTIRGIKGKIWAAARLLVSGRILIGATWSQIDEQIQLIKKQSSKQAPVISHKDL